MVVQRQQQIATLSLSASIEAEVVRLAVEGGVAAPVPLVSGGEHDVLGASFAVVQRLDGESIPRKILRDERFSAARGCFVADAGRQLALIHGLDPNSAAGRLPAIDDPLRWEEAIYRSFDDPHPVFELALRWLDANQPPAVAPTVVHGDFRMGNLLIDDGIVGVLDWELAAAADPRLDLGWLTCRSWRFGGPGEVGGLGAAADLLAAYRAAGGIDVSVDDLRWFQALATLRWGNVCLAMTARLNPGRPQSVELATIGRRIAEVEYDLFRTLPELVT